MLLADPRLHHQEAAKQTLRPSDPKEPWCRLGQPVLITHLGMQVASSAPEKCVRVAHPEPWHECSGQARPQRPRQEPVTMSFPGQRVTRAAGREVGGASDRRDGLVGGSLAPQVPWGPFLISEGERSDGNSCEVRAGHGGTRDWAALTVPWTQTPHP